MKRRVIAIVLILYSLMCFSQSDHRVNIRDANGNLLGYTLKDNNDANKIKVFDSEGNLLEIIEFSNDYYDRAFNICNNSVKLEYKNDPFVKEIKQDYQKLSNSAWGIEEKKNTTNFNPIMIEGINPFLEDYGKYVAEFNELVSFVGRFNDLGIDITQPTSNPEIRPAQLEWQKRWNDNYILGKKLQMLSK